MRLAFAPSRSRSCPASIAAKTRRILPTEGSRLHSSASMATHRVALDLSGPRPPVHYLCQEWNEEKPSGEKEDTENRDIPDEPPYVFPQLRLFPQGPLFSSVSLLHEQMHKTLEMTRLVHDEIHVLSDSRPDKIRHHTLHGNPDRRYHADSGSITRPRREVTHVNRDLNHNGQAACQPPATYTNLPSNSVTILTCLVFCQRQRRT
jgi:hypothetical protein